MSGVPSSESDPIRAVRQRHIEAIKAEDVDAIVSFYCEEAILMAPNEPTLYGRAEVKEWWEEYFLHFKIIALSETEYDVQVMDGLALERSAYMIALQPIKGGERIRDDVRRFGLWKHDADGAWRMSQVMTNSIRPVGSGTSRFLARMMQQKKHV